MNFENQSIWDFVTSESLGEFEKNSEDLVARKNLKLRSLTFHSKENPIKIIKQNNPRNYDFKVEEKDGYAKVSLEREIQHASYEKGYRVLKGSFVIFKNSEEDVWTATTPDGEDFYENAVNPFIRMFRPDFSMSYLTSEEMRKVLEVIEDRINGKVMSDKIIFYSRNQEANMSFETSDFQTAFNKAEEEDGYVDKIEFYLDTNSGEEFRGYLTRHGHTRYISGNKEFYYNHLLENLAESISKKTKLFRDREKEANSEDGNTIEIKFDRNTIEDTKDNKRVIDVLQKIKKSSVVVYHDNPYLHASVLSYEDGTSADVFITNDDTISIIPGFKASEDGLMKIADQISQGFEEGKVRNKVEKEKNFEYYFD